MRLPALSAAVFAVFLGLWSAGGFYNIGNGEAAVLETFGSAGEVISSQGLHWRIPGFQKLRKRNLRTPIRDEIGYRTTVLATETRAPEYQDIEAESLMLTGDEQVANVQVVVTSEIMNYKEYLYANRDPDKLRRDLIESTLRAVVGRTPFDTILTSGKAVVQSQISDELTRLFIERRLGVRLRTVQIQDVFPPNQVRQAFKAVTDAREAKNSAINKAREYATQTVNRAQAEAAKLLQEAEAYKVAKVNSADGEVGRLEQIIREYARNREVTRERLYLETMQEIMPRLEITVMEKGVTVPYYLPVAPQKGGEPR